MAEAIFDGIIITGWQSFHLQAAKVFGFPDFYENNMNAFIDCLTYLTEGDGMSSFSLKGAEQLHIHVSDFREFSTRQPEICWAFLESLAFVNLRYIELGISTRLVDIPR